MPSSRRARWPIRGCPRPSLFTSAATPGAKSTLAVRDGDKVLASRDITFAADGKIQTESLLFNAGDAGAKALQFSIDPLPGEENQANNAVTRLVNVESDKRRILYMEGEPRWEYKFIRRAEDDDPNRAGRLDAAHHREQDLSPGDQRPQGTGRRLPYQRRRSFRLPGDSSSARWKRATSRRRSRI